jgi:hypothetical protein
MRIGKFTIRGALPFALSACSGFTEPGPSQVVITALVPQTSGVVGELTEAPPAVSVKSETDDQPVRGVIVEFRPVNAQYGAVGALSDTTDAMGIATAGTWKLGLKSGLQQLRVFVPKYSRSTFLDAVARAGPVSYLNPATSLKQAVLNGRDPLPPSIRALDRFDNPVSGIAVQFTVTTGGGSLGASSATTNSNGTASAVTWSIPPASGTYSSAASSSSLIINFTAQRVDSSTLAWYALDSVIVGTRPYAPSEWGIRTARLGLPSFDLCLCVNVDALYFEILDYSGASSLSQLSGDFRISDRKISMQFVDTVKVTDTSVQLKRLDDYYDIFVTWLYKRKP